jgi:hypothetical protein
VRLKRRDGRKDHRSNSASLAGIVHRGRKAIVLRVARAGMIGVLVAAVKVEVVKAEDAPKDATKAGRVVAEDDPSKGSLKSS